MSTQSAQQHCPSCGRSTALTTYGPEPSLCVECQRAYGLLPVTQRLVGPRPDEPVWGATAAVCVWFAAIFALLAAELGGVVYLIYAGRHNLPIPPLDKQSTDPTIALVHILASGIAHIATFAVVYLVVTDGGRFSFFKSIGWGWPKSIKFRQTVLLAIALQVFTLVASYTIQAPDSTPFSRMLESSEATKIAVAIFAVVTAPFIEELVYRGVLYPALARPFGRAAAIIIVSALFVLVHAEQYDGALAIMIPLGALSVTLTALRAYTGSLLPSVVLHILFNAITVLFLFVPIGQ